MESNYHINRYTGEFVSPETEEKFQNHVWPVLSRRLLITILLGAVSYLFASCISRPGFIMEYRIMVVFATRIVVGILLLTALITKINKQYSKHLRLLIVLAELSIGLLESMDHFYYLKSISNFYDVGTSFLVFYIFLFYIIIPNRVKLTVVTIMVISTTFITVTYLSSAAAFVDLFTTFAYFLIVNFLGYGILLTTNKLNRNDYIHKLQLEKEIDYRKKVEQEATEAKQFAEDSNNAKSQFLAVMNHEMRTPLNIILGGIQLLKNSNLSEEHKEILSLINNSGERLKGLIQNILDFTNIEKNKLHIRKERFSLKQMIIDIEKVYSKISEEKGLDFITFYGTDLCDFVIGDSLRLHQILTNLLNNAVKFTETGSISLNIDTKNNDGNEILLRFQISDTGIGIPEKHFETILKPFTQVEQSNTRSFDGSGLGLAICSELLDAMNSKLEIESKLSSGSTFGFNLLLTIDSDEHSTEEEINIDSYKILLIDDIEANLKIVGGLFESLNQNVSYALGSRQGIEKSRHSDFDAIIIDLHMPEKDGIETAKEIWEKNPDVKTFLLTADSRNEIVIKAENIGFTGYISKPVCISQLKESLKLIGSKNNLDLTQVNENGIKNIINCNDVINRAFIQELRSDLNDDVLLDILKSCIKTLEESIIMIKDNDFPDNKDDIIHQLKGVAGNYRLTQLYNALENADRKTISMNRKDLTEIIVKSISALDRIASSIEA
ncbi:MULTISPECIES: ATP-binding protein [unclassified Oceanispirochaeta]|uniref:ATP-binding protein n=1 Tax=unclassified Oceanispirochaeta TaxID=2635722 RepID=UPI000E09DF76|nr:MULTISPECIES: ATP-binding protein [unclassified Oceanispirochaeta]MBF9018272.1 response regulator [Oceanispirochaeta sp. M2]NPD74737.1 response regulator [Oceanispirochaeta sp. M1]RDG29407.1 response regulator [Oceanispirochaeta sp. M1]